MNPSRLLLALLLILTAVRLAWAWRIPLDWHEAYWTVCGRAPAVAVFDGPAGTALLAATPLFLGAEPPEAARLAWPLLALLASVALWSLLRRLVSAEVAIGAVLLLNLLPVFFAASVRISPVMPGLAFGLLFLAAGRRALDQPRSGAIPWLGAGVALAAGLFSGYGALLFALAFLVGVAASRRDRWWLRRGVFWLAFAPAGGMAGALLWWNQQHDWIHFIGGTWQTFWQSDLSALPAALAAAAWLLSPVAAFLVVLAWVHSLGCWRRPAKIRSLGLALLLCALPVLHGFWQGRLPELWLATTAAFGLPLGLHLAGRRSRATAATTTMLTAGTAALFTGALLWPSASLPRGADAEMARAFDTLRREMESREGAALFLIARDAPMAAMLQLQLPALVPARPGDPPIYIPESPFAGSQYALWPRYDAFVAAPAPPDGARSEDAFTEQEGINPFLGRSALYITTERPAALPQSIRAAFSSVLPVAELRPTESSDPPLLIYLCRDYQTMPL